MKGRIFYVRFTSQPYEEGLNNTTITVVPDDVDAWPAIREIAATIAEGAAEIDVDGTVTNQQGDRIGYVVFDEVAFPGWEVHAAGLESEFPTCIDCGRERDGGTCIVCGRWVCDACQLTAEDEGPVCPGCEEEAGRRGYGFEGEE